jgi:F-type H+-transporting ATPase subunit gamma
LELGEVYLTGDERQKEVQIKKKKDYEYEFEPDKIRLLEKMLPKLVEVQIYQALLESYASEHSARMVAMKSASESSDELKEELTLNYNRARQAGITAEIAEISAGAQALE